MMDHHQSQMEPNIPLAVRMKDYENTTDLHLLPEEPAIMRLDGHAFSKFTVGFDRPFDQRLHMAFVLTCEDLLRHFPAASVAYTQSDEITLVFPGGCASFNDRVQKIASLAAGLTSARFNAHLRDLLEASPDPEVPDWKLGWGYFDARLFNVPTIEECVNNILWRCRNDCVRNGVSAFARTVFSTKQLQSKNTTEAIEMLREKGIHYGTAVPVWAPEGSLLKKELYQIPSTDGKTNEPVMATRMRVIVRDHGIRKFSEEAVRLVQCKYWNDLADQK